MTSRDRSEQQKDPNRLFVLSGSAVPQDRGGDDRFAWMSESERPLASDAHVRAPREDSGAREPESRRPWTGPGIRLHIDADGLLDWVDSPRRLLGIKAPIARRQSWIEVVRESDRPGVRPRFAGRRPTSANRYRSSRGSPGGAPYAGTCGAQGTDRFAASPIRRMPRRGRPRTSASAWRLPRRGSSWWTRPGPSAS